MESTQVARFRDVVPEMAEYWNLFIGHMVRPGS
jgi:hypothetical protein